MQVDGFDVIFLKNMVKKGGGEGGEEEEEIIRIILALDTLAVLQLKNPILVHRIFILLSFSFSRMCFLLVYI
jgi:hypothetical protein